MAVDAKIGDLAAVPAIASNDVLPIVHTADDTTYKATLKQIADAVTLEGLKSFTLAEPLSVGDIVQALNDGTIRKCMPNGVGEEDIMGTPNVYAYKLTARALSSNTFVIGIGSSQAVYLGTITGNTVTYGPVAYFTQTPDTYDIVRLTDTSFLVVVACTDGFMYSFYGSVSGTTISFIGNTLGFAGPDVVTSSGYVYAQALTSSSVVVAYRRSSSYGAVVPLSVSVGSVVYQTETVVASETVQYASCAALNSTQFAFVWWTSGYGKSVIGTVSAGTISFGSVATHSTHSFTHVAADRLSDTSFIIAYSSTNSYALIATVSGTTITYQTAAQIAAAQRYFFRVCVLSSSLVAVISVDGTYIPAVYAATISGNTLTFGAAASITGSYATLPQALVPLSATSFVAVHNLSTPSWNGAAIIGTVSGTTITYGSRYNFVGTLTSGSNGSVLALSGSTFISFYEGGIASIGTLSGSTVTYTPPTQLNPVIAGMYWFASKLSDTSFVMVCRRNSDYYGVAVIATVSGSTITWGTPSVFSTVNTHYIAVDRLSDTSFVVTYCDQANWYPYARVATVSGGVMTWGTASNISAANAGGRAAVTRMTDTSFIVAHTGTSSYGYARAATVSGTTISWGTASAFNSSSTSFYSIHRITDTSFVIGYFSGQYIKAIAGSLSGTVLAWGTAITVSSATGYSCTGTAIRRVTDTSFVIAFSGGQPIHYFAVGTISGLVIACATPVAYANTGGSNTIALSVEAFNGTSFIILYNNSATNIKSIVGSMQTGGAVLGIAQTSGLAGGTVRVAQFGQISSVHSGLIQGNMYFYNSSSWNGLATTGTFRAGGALSDTQVMLGVEVKPVIVAAATPTKILAGDGQYYSFDGANWYVAT